MGLAKKISMTLAVIIFTALSVYNLQRAVPESDIEYAKYSMSYHTILFLSFGCFLVLMVSKYRNRLIVSLLFFTALTFLFAGIKGYFKQLSGHNSYDIAALCIFGMMSFSYLIAPYYKKALILFKTKINQIYMRCQTNRKSG